MTIGEVVMVGRTQEMERLHECAATARSGRRRVVVVGGEAGIGKSRLVSEGIVRCREPEDLVLVGHCVELSGGELPYGLVSDCLRSVVRELGVKAIQAQAGNTLPALAALCPPLGTGPSVVDRAQIIGAFVSLIERLAADRLVWLVVEDLHWSDASSRDLLGYLLRVTGPCRLAVFITTRTSDPGIGPDVFGFLTELVRVPDVDLVTLSPLSRSEVAEQVAALTDVKVSSRLVERVFTLSQGVPFLTQQLIAAGITDSGPVPSSTWEPMLARVHRLDPDARRLIQMASLADGHLTHDLLELVYTETDPDESSTFNAAVTTVTRSQLMRYDPTRHAYEFAHALLRNAVDASIDPVNRLRWHRTWATALSQDPGHASDPQLQVAIAHHWAEANADAEAFDSALAAAAQCARLGAMGETALMLRRALDLWDRVPEAAARAGRTRDSVLYQAINALDRDADDDAAVALIDAELRRSHARDDPIRHLCLELERDTIALALGQDADSPLWQRAVESVDTLLMAEPSPFVVVGLVDLGWHFSDNHPDRSMNLATRAANLADQVGELHLRESATGFLSCQLAYHGRFDEAIRTCARLLDELPGSTTELADLEHLRGRWLLRCGRYREAVTALEHSRSRLGDPQLAERIWASVTEALAEGFYILGRWDEAQALVDALAETPAASTGPLAVWMADLAGTLSCQRGDVGRAREWLKSASLHVPPDEARAWSMVRVSYRHLQAQVAIAGGEPERAREALAPLWEASGPTSVTFLEAPLILAAEIEAEIADARHHPPEAASSRTIEAIRATASRGPRLTGRVTAEAAHLDAALARACGGNDPAMWLDVVDRWRELGHIPYLARSLVWLAAAYLGAGDRKAAAAPLAEAFHTASELGAEPLRGQIVELAQRHRIQLAGQSAQGDRGEGRLARLTDRELEVLQLVAQGMSNNEIAGTLFISPKTASVHIHRILTKLGVNSRAKATAIAYAAGIPEARNERRPSQ